MTSMRSAPAPSGRGPPRRADRPPLGAPLFVLNLKTYPRAVGAHALALARALAGAGQRTGVSVAIAPASPDLSAVVASVSIPVLAQHADVERPGPATGFLPVPALVAAGVRGSLVNHSEHPLPTKVVGRTTRALADAGLSAIVCARDPSAGRRLARFRPPYVAIEPPELIGGDRAVSTAKPEAVVQGVAAVAAVSPETRTLCGAGIRSRADVRRALELGAEGVLVASAVALAERPARVIEELLRGF